MTKTFFLKTRGQSSTIDFSADLNKEQHQVATAPGGPMLVVAGAGSGKTRVLTYRLAWLVSQGIDPHRILLVTFTNRAAREMLRRVELLLQKNTREIWGGTFHHIANRLLRRYGSKLKLSSEFSILDREDTQDLIASCVQDVGVDIKKKRFPQKAVLAAISSFHQNTLVSISDVINQRYSVFSQEAFQIEKVLTHYQIKKQEKQLLDFDDLLSYWLRLLKEHEDIRSELAAYFQHILVDEYQDTNAIQGRIIDLLASQHQNLTVVGDDAQSIYGFRGANFENIISFKSRYPGCQEYRLEINYRSRPEILSLANYSIVHNQQRLKKTLRAVRKSGMKPVFVPCVDHFTQSRFIAEYVLHLLDEGRHLNDLAILYRSHWHSMEIQLELQRRNIPFQVRGGLRFFEQAHMKDMLCFLRILQNPHDELAWYRLLRLLPKVGGVLSKKIWQHIGTTNNPLQHATQSSALEILPKAAQPFYEDFSELLCEMKALNSPADVIELVLIKTYDEYLDSRYDNAALRKEDIRALSNFAAQYKDLEAFLTEVVLTGDFSGETVINGPEEKVFLTLSTVHQSKGLEWPIVFIPWLADGRFPTDLAMKNTAELEEERRVFYVAVTRAKDELYLVVPQMYRNRGYHTVVMKPSRFLTEINREAYEKMEIREELPFIASGET